MGLRELRSKRTPLLALCRLASVSSVLTQKAFVAILARPCDYICSLFYFCSKPALRELYFSMPHYSLRYRHAASVVAFRDHDIANQVACRPP